MAIYFDNASTTPLLAEVKEAMTSVINENFGNPSSIHKFGRESRILVEDARKSIALGLGASTGEIFFTSGATESNNMTFLSCVQDLGVKRIISSKIEHHCILHMLDYLSKDDSIEIILLDVDNKGIIDYHQLDQLLQDSDRKTLVSLMHANNELGNLNDIQRIGEICKLTGSLFHTDTAQTIGKVPIDVSETNINFLSGSAHKFFGPKGTGFIYIKNENMIKPMFHGGDQERGIRSGTENIYGIVGMNKAFNLALEQMQDRKTKILELRQLFTSRLTTELDDILINGDNENSLYNIVSVSFPATSKSEMMMMNLDIMGIAASSGSACSSGVENSSHVLNAINHDASRKTVRFSFSHFNTQDEVNFVIDKLKTITPAKVAVNQ